jgi:predicted Fe-S protein YdhL (DUF1289 family)
MFKKHVRIFPAFLSSQLDMNVQGRHYGRYPEAMWAPFLHVVVTLTYRRPSAALSFCRGCERFLAPPANWTIAEPESQELLALCLKKLKGLNKVRLTDAHFIWTEPHSRRLKVSLTIQKEASNYLIMLVIR